MLKNLTKEIYREFSSHAAFYILLSAILFVAFFLRVYRTTDLMGFYYDQGRDALVIWKLWHEGKLFLVGPVTGLHGIFLGPFFYYLIAPFYLIGRGNPAYPAIFLATLSVFGIFLIYYLGWKIHKRSTGIIGAAIAAVSYNLILSGRWLSNPTPILFTSMVVVLSMYKIIENKSKTWWLVLALFVGLSLQLESASAVFYLPIVLLFTVWFFSQPRSKAEFSTSNKINLILNRIQGAKWILLISLLLLILTFIPQIWFNFRHDNLLLNSFRRVFLTEKSFRLDFWTVLTTRLDYFLDVFGSKLFPQRNYFALTFFVISFLALVSNKSKLKNPKIVSLLMIFLITPLIFYILFQGNYGNIYDYYLTGYFYPFVLLLSLGFGILWQNKAGKIIVILFFIPFFYRNFTLEKNFLSAGVDGPTHITLGNELQSVDWIYENATVSKIVRFNADVYVPPVIPHSYEYLLLWQGTIRCGKNLCGLNKDSAEKDLYLIYEVDPPHPERLVNWLSKYEANTLVLDQRRFGGVTVEKRIRI